MRSFRDGLQQFLDDHIGRDPFRLRGEAGLEAMAHHRQRQMAHIVTRDVDSARQRRIALRAVDQRLAGAWPSAPADLLGPITESGRAGWNCAPELAASAVTARAAELPADRR